MPRTPRVRKVDPRGRVNVTYWLPETMVDRLAALADEKTVHPQVLVARAVEAWLDDLLPPEVAVFTRTDLRRAAAGLDHPQMLLPAAEETHPVVAHLREVHGADPRTFEEANRLHQEMHSDPETVHEHNRMDYRLA